MEEEEEDGVHVLLYAKVQLFQATDALLPRDRRYYLTRQSHRPCHSRVLSSPTATTARV